MNALLVWTVLAVCAGMVLYGTATIIINVRRHRALSRVRASMTEADMRAAFEQARTDDWPAL